MDRLIRDLVAAANHDVEDCLYTKYENFDVVELVQDNFTLYGKLVLLDLLKPTQLGATANYKRKADKYYGEMN